MYNSDLEELIAFYKLEKQNLQTLIDDCVKELDFQLAEYHFQAFRLVNRKLQTLENLYDQDFDEKEWFKKQISFYKKEAEESQRSSLKEHYTESIEKLEEKLTLLEQKQTNKEKVGIEFDNILFDLVEGLINGFIFYLKKDENLYLRFIKDKDYLLISFTPFEKLPDYTFEDEKHVLALGFYINKELSCFQYSYDLKKFKNSRFIKTLVSRIIFDIFYFKSLDSNTTIEIF